jgi:hypothetical protein
MIYLQNAKFIIFTSRCKLYDTVEVCNHSERKEYNIYLNGGPYNDDLHLQNQGLAKYFSIEVTSIRDSS